MSVYRRLCAVATSALLTIPLLALTTTEASGEVRERSQRTAAAESPQVVLDWERILMQTVYPVTPIPSGVPLLGFTSVAMHDAVKKSMHRTRSSETAAVAQAAGVSEDLVYKLLSGA